MNGFTDQDYLYSHLNAALYHLKYASWCLFLSYQRGFQSCEAHLPEGEFKGGCGGRRFKILVKSHLTGLIFIFLDSIQLVLSEDMSVYEAVFSEASIILPRIRRKRRIFRTCLKIISILDFLLCKSFPVIAVWMSVATMQIGTAYI